jgi:hypothetical protein
MNRFGGDTMSKGLEKVVADSSEGCCGGPAPTDTDACCVADADAKTAGDDGCGCETSTPETTKKVSSCC